MKKLISNYTFDASLKKLTFNDYATIDLENLLLITNVTDNIIIYNFADNSKGGGVSGNSVTFTYDTTSMSDDDALQIYYEDSSENLLTEELFHLFKRITRLMQPLATVDSSDRQIVRVSTIDTGLIGTVNAVNSVGPVNSLTALSNVDARYLLMDLSRNTYANSIRTNLIS